MYMILFVTLSSFCRYRRKMVRWFKISALVCHVIRLFIFVSHLSVVLVIVRFLLL